MFATVTRFTRRDDIGQRMITAFCKRKNMVLRQFALASTVAVRTAMIVGCLDFQPLRSGKIVDSHLTLACTPGSIIRSKLIWMGISPSSVIGAYFLPVLISVRAPICRCFLWMLLPIHALLLKNRHTMLTIMRCMFCSYPGPVCTITLNFLFPYFFTMLRLVCRILFPCLLWIGRFICRVLRSHPLTRSCSMRFVISLVVCQSLAAIFFSL